MNASEAIFYLLSNSAAISGIVSDRIYPLYSPQAYVAPFVTYQIVNNNPSNTKTGASITDSVLFQVNCVGKDYDSTLSLREVVRSALDYQSVDGIQNITYQGERAMWSESSQLQGAVAFAQDYRVREKR